MTPQSYEYFLIPQFFLWKERLERGSWDSRGVATIVRIEILRFGTI